MNPFRLAISALFAAASMFVHCATYNATYTTNGVTYAQRGGLTIRDYVVTNVEVQSSMDTNAVVGIVHEEFVSPLFTNSVCSVVTNEITSSVTYGDWVWTGVSDDPSGDPSYDPSTGLWTIPDIGDFYADIGLSVPAPADATNITWTIYFKSDEVSILVGDSGPEYCELWLDDSNVYSGTTTNAFFSGGDYYEAESASVADIAGGSGNNFTFIKFSPRPVTASRDAIFSTSNALGLARISDLPQNTPIDRILINGGDGKTYSITIDSTGSLIVSEVAQ